MTHAEMPPTSEIDCGDNSCQFATSKGGMRTNGGCTCYEKAGFHRSAIRSAQLMLPEIRRLREALQESQARESRAREEGRLEGIAEERAKSELLDKFVKRLAKNATIDELKAISEECYEHADFEGGYEIIIMEARAAASRSGEGEAPDPDWERE